MTARGDYVSGMDGMESGTQVSDFLTELRSMGEQPPPFPSPELAALLVGGIPISSAPSRRRLDIPRRVAHTCVAAAAALVITLAAENATLSNGAEHLVSNFVGNVLGTQHHHPAQHPAVSPTSHR